MYTGGVVPVKIVDIAAGVGLFVGGGGRGTVVSAAELNPEAMMEPGLERAASAASQPFETHDKDLVMRNIRERSKELDKVLKGFDAHQFEVMRPEFQEKMN